MKGIYIDNASTTSIRSEVFEAMLPFLKGEYGNPSSLYEIGINNKKVINQCRKRIAALLNAKGNEIYFCSGGSEANNWAIKGTAFAQMTKREIITTKIEHHSILNSCHFLEKLGYKIHYLDVDKSGFIDLKSLEKAINDNTFLVTVMMANNEIGTIQKIKEIGKLCRKRNVLFHTDAIQAAPHLAIDVEDMCIDLLSISGHKFHAPKGIGCLYIRNGVTIENLIHGGNQEKEKRAGTENVAYIVGMAKALELVSAEMDFNSKRERELVKILFKKIKDNIPDLKLNGPDIGEDRLPGNLNISFKNQDGVQLAFELNKLGIFVSTGSACNSGSIEPSHVLRAIDVPDDYIRGTIRMTIGKDLSMEDLEFIAGKIVSLVK